MFQKRCENRNPFSRWKVPSTPGEPGKPRAKQDGAYAPCDALLTVVKRRYPCFLIGTPYLARGEQMDQTTRDPGHSVPVQAHALQMCIVCGSIVQTPDPLVPDESEPLPLWQTPQKIQPRPRFHVMSILLGLLPLL